MASNRMRRVGKEIEDIRKDEASQIMIESDGSDITKLRASFPGPPDTPYEGGTYAVNITVPNEYPFRPLVMKFSTKVWHPNISSQTVSISWSLYFIIISNLFLGSYLPRYSWHSLVTGSHHQVNSSITPISS